MLLTEQEIKRIGEGNTGSWQDDLQFARAIESAVLEKLKAQEQAKEPVGWYFMDDPQVVAMPGSGYFPGRTPPNDAVNLVPLYTHPLPPADVVRDAERWRMHVRLYSERLGVPEEDVIDELDAAMKEMK